MSIGFVLVTTAPASQHMVYEELRKIKEISEFHPLIGEYDFIIEIEGEDLNAIGKVIVDKIRRIDGIIDTKSLTTIYEKKEEEE